MGRKNLENNVTFGEQRSKINDNFNELYIIEPDYNKATIKQTNVGKLNFTWTADANGWCYRLVQVTHPASNYITYSGFINGVQVYIQTFQGQTTTGTPQNTSQLMRVKKGDEVEFKIEGPAASTITTNTLYFIPSTV